MTSRNPWSAAALCCAALTSAASFATAQVATFENFAEGSLGASFTDSLSGIQFIDPTSDFGNTFTIETAAANAALPRTTPGNWLRGGVFTAGSGASQTNHFSFTMVLPQATDRLSMDVIQFAVPNRALRLDLFDSAGMLLDSPTFALGGSLSELSVGFTRATADVKSVRVVNAVSTYTAYDNITIPEPATGGAAAALIAVVAAGAGALGRRRVR